MKSRSFVAWASSCLTIVLLSAATVASAVAAPVPSATASADPDAKPPLATAATVDGRVTRVDYQSSRLTLATAHGSVDVTVLPSTNIQGKGGFATLADIVKGQHLSILTSDKGGSKFAQMIQLVK